MIEGSGIFVGIGLFVLFILLCLLIPDLFQKFRKCEKCGKRNNKRHVHGQYNCSWYECKCDKK